MIRSLSRAIGAALLTATLCLGGHASAAARKPIVLDSGQPEQIQAGDTIQASAPTTANASINLPHGTAPSSPTNGDCWTTTAGLYCRINGATVGPLSAGGTPGGSSGQIQYNNSGAFGGGDLSGDVSTAGSLVTAIGSNKVTDAMLRQSAGLSVVARSANSTGNVADVTAGTDGHVLRRSGTTLGFGTVATAGLTDDAVTYAKMQNVSAASKLLGRGSASGSGDPEEITLGSNLTMSGTTLSASGSVTGAGGLLAVQVITATGAGTYTPTSGTSFIVIEMVGGGGGGGGRAGSLAANNVGVGGGGGGGAYLRKRLTANFSGASYSVGAKGTGGAAGNNNGTAGGNTTFTTTGGGAVTYTASGGGGAGGTSGSASQVVNSSTSATATNGDLNVGGGVPGFGIGFPNNFFGYGGTGGSSFYGAGGAGGYVAATNGGTAGVNGSGYGGGGGGAAVVQSGSSVKGGDGTDGILIIWEYS